jgi:hypothetical protein
MAKLWKFLEIVTFLIALGAGIAIQGHLAANSERYTTYIVTVSADIDMSLGSVFEIHAVPPRDPVAEASSSDNATNDEAERDNEDDTNARLQIGDPVGDPPDGQGTEPDNGSAEVGSQDGQATEDTPPEGIPLTPSMRAITLLMLAYFFLRYVLARLIRPADATSDVFYYLGFLLTISAIAVGMGGAPNIQSSPGSVMSYITRVIQETGSAIWSTILGFLLRHIGAPFFKEIRQAGKKPPSKKENTGWLFGKLVEGIHRAAREGAREGSAARSRQEDSAGREETEASKRRADSSSNPKTTSTAAARRQPRPRPGTWRASIQDFAERFHGEGRDDR